MWKNGNAQTSGGGGKKNSFKFEPSNVRLRSRNPLFFHEVWTLEQSDALNSYCEYESFNLLISQYLIRTRSVFKNQNISVKHFHLLESDLIFRPVLWFITLLKFSISCLAE